MSTLAERLAARPGDEPTPLATLESGAVISLDRSVHWIHTSGEGGVRSVFSPGAAAAFAEVVEQSRDAFEDALLAAARAAELPEDEVVAAFPALDVIRAVLAKEYAYMTRLALLWIRPSELRELRPEIVAVTKTPQMPGPVKDLARRLTVAEGDG